VSLIPDRYFCSGCGGYTGWVGRRRPAHRCTCEDDVRPAREDEPEQFVEVEHIAPGKVAA